MKIISFINYFFSRPLAVVLAVCAVPLLLAGCQSSSNSRAMGGMSGTGGMSSSVTIVEVPVGAQGALVVNQNNEPVSISLSGSSVYVPLVAQSVGSTIPIVFFREENNGTRTDHTVTLTGDNGQVQAVLGQGGTGMSTTTTVTTDIAAKPGFRIVGETLRIARDVAGSTHIFTVTRNLPTRTGSGIINDLTVSGNVTMAGDGNTAPGIFDVTLPSPTIHHNLYIAGGETIFIARAANAAYGSSGFQRFIYGQSTAPTVLAQLSMSAMRQQYEIPAHTARGGYLDRNEVSNSGYLSNPLPGFLTVDYGSNNAFLDLIYHIYGSAGYDNGSAFLSLIALQMRLNAQGGFSNASCPLAAGSGSATNCGGTVSVVAGAFGNSANTSYQNSTSASSATLTVLVTGRVYGSTGEESAGIVQMNGSGTDSVPLYALQGGFLGLPYDGATPYHIALSRADTLRAEMPYWALPLRRNAATATMSGFLVSTAADGTPRQFLQPSPTPPTTLPALGNVGETALTVNGAALATLQVRRIGSGAGAQTLFGFKRGTAVAYNIGITNAAVALPARPYLSLTLTTSGVSGAMVEVTLSAAARTITVNIVGNGMISSDNAHIAYYRQAEYAAFFYSFSGGSLREAEGAAYGVRTPQAVLSMLAVGSLVATYSIPSDAAHGQYFGGANVDNYFLSNKDAGELVADFGNSVVTLNLTLDAYPWDRGQASGTDDDFVQITDWAMTMRGNGAFDNAHCINAAANCSGTVTYDTSTPSTHTNVSGGGNGIQAGGAFFGPNAEEVAGGIYHEIDVDDGVHIQFVGVGAGGRR